MNPEIHAFEARNGPESLLILASSCDFMTDLLSFPTWMPSAAAAFRPIDKFQIPGNNRTAQGQTRTAFSKDGVFPTCLGWKC
jgi:hypothetical protein